MGKAKRTQQARRQKEARRRKRRAQNATTGSRAAAAGTGHAAHAPGPVADDDAQGPLSGENDEQAEGTPEGFYDAFLELVRASGILTKAAEQYFDTLYKHLDTLDLVAMPDHLHAIASLAGDDTLRSDLDDLVRAWRVLTDGAPVAADRPHSVRRQNESHIRWRGPLSPAQILYYAHIADENDGNYWQQLHANTEYYRRKDDRAAHEAEASCGRTTTRGTPCRARPVYMPPHGRRSGFACQRHLTAEEANNVAQAYDAAVANHDCPGCAATAGRRCYTGEDAGPYLRLIDGEWARHRSATVNGKQRVVHDVRLLRVTPTV